MDRRFHYFPPVSLSHLDQSIFRLPFQRSKPFPAAPGATSEKDQAILRTVEPRRARNKSRPNQESWLPVIQPEKQHGRYSRNPNSEARRNTPRPWLQRKSSSWRSN